MSRHWNYRVLRHCDEFDKYYTIHEMYYQDGKPESHAEVAMSPLGDTFADLKGDFTMLAQAFDKPVLDAETYEEVEPGVKKPAMKEVADRIRVMAIGCESQDVMSCKFGNEFGDKVLEYLNEIFG